MNFKFVATGLLVAGIVAAAGGTARAQRAADAKIRGDAYYFYVGEVYRGHAGDHAFMLNQYSSTGEPVPKEIIQEHASAMRADIAAAQKSYTKVSAAAKKDPSAAAGLKTIEKHHTAAIALCEKLDAEGAKQQGDAMKVCAACDGIGEQLDAADEVHKKLVKQLKIAPLEPPAQ
ncbi:MAG TPA: hypothetical protein VHY91_02080 [Pirellulales bacterium]|jgi:hypothetical protein|nr:hypothetical protein [Pirellulales bacterium]